MNKKIKSINSNGQLAPMSMLKKLDNYLNLMDDKIDNAMTLLNMYLELEEVIRSYVLKDHPSLEKQLEAIKECKNDVGLDGITEELPMLIDQSVSIIGHLIEPSCKSYDHSG